MISKSQLNSPPRSPFSFRRIEIVALLGHNPRRALPTAGLPPVAPIPAGASALSPLVTRHSPLATQFLIATVARIEISSTNCKQRRRPNPNRNKKCSSRKTNAFRIRAGSRDFLRTARPRRAWQIGSRPAPSAWQRVANGSRLEGSGRPQHQVQRAGLKPAATRSKTKEPAGCRRYERHKRANAMPMQKNSGRNGGVEGLGALGTRAPEVEG